MSSRSILWTGLCATVFSLPVVPARLHAEALVLASQAVHSATEGAHVEPAATPTRVTALRVAAPIHIDASMANKGVWDSEQGGTGILRTVEGLGMVPYSEARARWDARFLYLWLYAGDLDLRGQPSGKDADLHGQDVFHVELTAHGATHVLDVSVLGALSDARCTGPAHEPGPRVVGECNTHWQSHARVAVDRDGSLNRIHDNDEEWLVELAIPWANLGMRNVRPGTHVGFSVSRCEVGYDGQHACGSWGLAQPGTLELAP
jgi:hypothetical protein